MKRNRQNLLKRTRNRAYKSQVKTAVRHIDEAIAQNAIEQAQDELRKAIPVIYKAAVKGALHKNNASRKVSRLTRRVNAFVKTAQDAA